jgi:predicted transcriptional regulator
MLLAGLLGSEGREQVLQYILARDSGYGREIAGFFGSNPSAIQKQLELLEVESILVSKKQGRTLVYSLNPRYFLLEELTALLTKARDAYKPELLDNLIKDRKRPRRNGKPL